LRAGHEALVEAIEAGDPERAARSVIENLDYCISWMP
jgi:DNA-binding GntR family transcriptional regulator